MYGFGLVTDIGYLTLVLRAPTLGIPTHAKTKAIIGKENRKKTNNNLGFQFMNTLSEEMAFIHQWT